ncbi:MAG: paraquat-inducible membrane protein A [Gammaproteobacteria bacterium]|nr:MAG: paraquat-inducible membrane protein A [Gammaproteobacteria bacterium]
MTTLTDALDERIACRSCDLLHQRPVLASGERARCVRCGDVIASNIPNGTDRVLASAIAGCVLIVVAVTLPFFDVSLAGLESRISLLDAVAALWQRGMLVLAVLVLASMIFLPFLRFLVLVIVFARIRYGSKPTDLDRQAFQYALLLEPWAMAEVFMVGVSVSLVKVASQAQVGLGSAFWAVLLLVVVTVYMKYSLSPEAVWRVLSRESSL